MPTNGNAGAALYAATKKLSQDGFIHSEDKVVSLNTGAGIKYQDTLQIQPTYLELDAEL